MIKLETIWVTHIWALDGPSSEFKLETSISYLKRIFIRIGN